MKRLAVAAMLLSAYACDKGTSKLDSAHGNAGVGATGGAGGGGASSQEVQQLQNTVGALESRIKALEAAHTPGAHSAGGPGEPTIVERVHRLESGLARREEALGFLDMAYAQQKRQMEQQEASEPDATAVFAVDINAALKNNQVEGPNSAIVTVVEAWDFA